MGELPLGSSVVFSPQIEPYGADVTWLSPTLSIPTSADERILEP